MNSNAPAHLLDHPRYAPFLESKPSSLPGLRPLDHADWLTLDPDYSAQMIARRALLEQRRNDVLDLDDSELAAAAARELLDLLVANALRYHGFQRSDLAATLRTPDGHTETLDNDTPLACAGRLFAEDFCLMLSADDGRDGEYRLAGAVLCFPSSWRLADKMRQPLTQIHDPVPEYDTALAACVNRVFHSLRVDRPAWRCNWLLHDSPDLYLEQQRKKPDAALDDWQDFYLRTERQTLLRLPASGAIVFGIKTSICPLTALQTEQRAALRQAIQALSDEMKRYKHGGAGYDQAARQLAAG